jgi:ribose transport system substrate-binding protein
MQVLQEANRKDVLVSGVDGLSEALNAIESGNQYISTSLNDPRYLGDITIQTAREVAAGKKVPSFVDAGTAVVTKDNVKQIKHDGLFGEYRPKVF